MALPPEILDKILEHIPTDREGRPTLISCALVAAWWTGPSQRRLFSSVSINNKNYQRWLGGVALSGSKTHLLQHVRSLRYYRSLGKGVRHPIPIQGLPAGEYFSALHNIHTLELVNIKIERSSKAEFGTCFSAFRETLTGLTLELLTTSFDALVNLVDYFPNVVTLRLSPSILELDEGPVPPLSRPLRGKLHIYYTEHDCLEFIDRFARLDMEYEELVIGSWFGLPTRFMESSLQLSPGTVKYLRLTVTLQREYPHHAPSPYVFTQPPCFRWSGIDDPWFSTTPRIGTGGGLARFYVSSPPFFNQLYPTPEDHHPISTRIPLEDSENGFDRQRAM